MATYDVAVLGSGPSGLTSAYCLGKAGARVVVLERAPQLGGLMRGVKRGDFNFDLGRKELYSRFPEVHALWSELLGEDYRDYEHRIGVVYEGRILERTSGPRGKLRGLSVGQVARVLGAYLWSQCRPGERHAESVEQYYVLRYGRAYYDAFVHGFQLKFDGRSPAKIPNMEGDREVPRFGFLRKQRGSAGKQADILFTEQQRWRHPALGTQQIVDELVRRSREFGVEFVAGAEVLTVHMDSNGDHVLSVRCGDELREIVARRVISSVPLPLAVGLLQPPPEGLGKPPADEVIFRKSTSLVYLLSDAPPRFPHNWLEVTDRKLKMGRVVNYATWNGRMVPQGKTGLCVEFFVLEGDPVESLSKEELYHLALREAASTGLIDPATVTDHLVIQLPKVNASTVIFDRKQEWLQAAAQAVSALPRFYETNRPGMDRATLAGIDAAAACLTDAAMSQRSLAASSSEL